jgi:hypothetical protein
MIRCLNRAAFVSFSLADATIDPKMARFKMLNLHKSLEFDKLRGQGVTVNQDKVH